MIHDWCRWLRQAGTDGTSFPVVGLYCYGGSFTWNYSNYACAIGGDGRCGNREEDGNHDFSGYQLMNFTGNVQKLHVYLPLPGKDPGPQELQLNAVQVVGNADSQAAWFYSPFAEAYDPGQVFHGFSGSIQNKGSFSNANCTVVWEGKTLSK